MLVFIVLLSVSIDSKAEVDLGVIGGINASSLKIEPVDEFEIEGRTGFGIGLFMNFQTNEFLSLQITPMYLQKGGNAKLDINFLDYTEFRADYLEIPILARFNFDAGTIKPCLLAGPSLGFQMNSTYLDADGNKEDISDETKGLDLSAVFGGGLEIELDGLSLFGQLTYSYGLSDIDDSDGLLDFTDEIYTRGVGVFVGISVPMGKN